MTALIPTYHLNIGEIIVSPQPIVISTVLGSCVSVALYCEKTCAGGMIHYAHPESLSLDTHPEDYRYGNLALPALIQQLIDLSGLDCTHFVAKLVGGAGEIDGISKTFDIGSANVEIAKKILSDKKIPIIGEDCGGRNGRKVLFHTTNCRLQVAMVASRQAEAAQTTQGPVNEKLPEISKIPFTMESKVPAKKFAKRKVLIVDDSKVIRDLLKRILQEDSDLEIIGFAADAIEAAEIVKKNPPDVITLDIHMPKMTGVEWLEKLLPAQPIPVVMISSLQFQEGNEVFRALELGAVDYIQKPSASELSIIGPLIREKVRQASYAKVIRHTLPHSEVVANNTALDMRKVLAIGASTGGTEALKSVLCAMPEQIPPTLIVQHIPPVFSKAFADRLNMLCPFEVKEAEDGDELRPSRVLIAPGGKQMKVQKTAKGYCVKITDDAPVSRHKPSVDYLFRSVAEVVGKSSVGVILTGMGSDGAKGLLEMRKKGSRTLGQDEESCVVYGMPRVAFETGAVEKEYHLDKIPREILNLLSIKKAA